MPSARAAGPGAPASGESHIDAVSINVLHELAPCGVLRAAINLGNPVLAQRIPMDSEPTGAAVDLARELGRRLGVPVALVTFAGAGEIVRASEADAWDVACFAIDPARAAAILYTASYVTIEGTYLVRDASPFHAVEDLDQAGVRIAVGTGAAYELYLTRTLKAAELVRAETSAAAVELFVAAGLEAAAGVKQPLLEYARTHTGLRVIDGRFTVLEQAMATPTGRDAARAYLQSFIEDMKRSGFVAAALERSDQRDVGVAPAQVSLPFGE